MRALPGSPDALAPRIRPAGSVVVTAVPSVPVPDLDTIEQRAQRWHLPRCPVISPAPRVTALCSCHGDRIVSAEDFDALIAAARRLVAVEAERDTLAAKIEAVEALMVEFAPDQDDARADPAVDIRRALSVVPGEREG
jgi:hypothetical protein